MLRILTMMAVLGLLLLALGCGPAAETDARRTEERDSGQESRLLEEKGMVTGFIRGVDLEENLITIVTAEGDVHEFRVRQETVAVGFQEMADLVNRQGAQVTITYEGRWVPKRAVIIETSG